MDRTPAPFAPENGVFKVQRNCNPDRRAQLNAPAGIKVESDERG
jgi:hypothetical protein